MFLVQPFLYALALSALAGPPAPEPVSIPEALVSPKRAVRFSALDRVKASERVHETWVRPLCEFVRVDAAQEFTSAPPGDPELGAITKVPLLGDEVSLPRIRAEPGDFTGKSFVICGGVTGSDYFNFGYSDAAKTHYAFHFRPVDAGGKLDPGRGSADLYLSRDFGKSLSQSVTRIEENPEAALLLRLTCTVRPERLGDRPQHILSSIEVEDWQFLGLDGKWAPSATEGVVAGLSQILRAGRPGYAALAGFATGEPGHEAEPAGVFIRLAAVKALESVPPDDRRSVLGLLRAAGRAARKPGVRTPGDAAADHLASVFGVADEAEPGRQHPPAKKADPAARAASLLAAGRNLERAGKPKGALEFYRRVLKEHPGTPQADQAGARAKAIDPNP